MKAVDEVQFVPFFFSVDVIGGRQSFIIYFSKIQPEMRDLMDTINRLSMLPADYEGRIAVHKW